MCQWSESSFERMYSRKTHLHVLINNTVKWQDFGVHEQKRERLVAHLQKHFPYWLILLVCLSKLHFLDLRNQQNSRISKTYIRQHCSTNFPPSSSAWSFCWLIVPNLQQVFNRTSQVFTGFSGTGCEGSAEKLRPLLFLILKTKKILRAGHPWCSIQACPSPSMLVRFSVLPSQTSSNDGLLMEHVCAKNWNYERHRDWYLFFWSVAIGWLQLSIW